MRRFIAERRGVARRELAAGLTPSLQATGARIRATRTDGGEFRAGQAVPCWRPPWRNPSPRPAKPFVRWPMTRRPLHSPFCQQQRRVLWTKDC